MKKPKCVLVGCGGISDAWLGSETVKRRVELVGLVDIRLAAAEARKSQFGLTKARTGTDLPAMLRQTQPDIVFDCSVPEAHCEVTLTALAHGCHVFGEKPISSTMQHAQKMVAASRKAGKFYAVMQNRRYQKEIRSLRRFLVQGTIGRIVAVHSDFFLGAYFSGFRDTLEHVLLLDMAIHSFDQARFISGENATGVYCQEWTPLGSRYQHGSSAAAIFEMTNGIIYTYRGSWCSEGCSTSWECAWRIIGEKGTVLWDGANNFRCEVVNPRDKSAIRAVQSKKVSVLGGNSRTGHDAAIRAFLDSVKKNVVPETVCTDNIKSLAMVHGTVKSVITGRRVRIPLA